MITTAVYNSMLDNQFPSGAGNLFFSAHTAYSATGANLTGAKTSANFSAAASRVKALSAQVDIAITAGNTVSWIGLWDSTQAVFKGMFANGGTERSFQLGITPNTILSEGHGLANNDKVAFHNDTVPGGLTEGTHYFVVGVAAGDPDTFQVSATLGGAAIDLTTQHGANCVVSKVIEELFGADGTLRILTTFNIKL